MVGGATKAATGLAETKKQAFRPETQCVSKIRVMCFYRVIAIFLRGKV